MNTDQIENSCSKPANKFMRSNKSTIALNIIEISGLFNWTAVHFKGNHEAKSSEALLDLETIPFSGIFDQVLKIET